MNVPNTSRYWVWLFACFTLMAVLTSLVWLYATGQSLDAARLVKTIIPEILFWNVWVLTAPFIFWLSGKFSYPVAPFSWKWVIHIPLALLSTSINFAIYIGFFSLHYLIAEALGQPINTSLLSEIKVRLHGIYSIALPLGSIIYGLLVVLSQVQTYYQRLQQEKDLSTALKDQLTEARREALHMQLHPHFLYNSLNTISATLQSDTAAADSMLSHLGDFLRNTLDHAEKSFVPLRDEIAFSQQYLQIEHHRFEDRLRVEVNLPAELEPVLVPYLILQPLVENAVRHGVGQLLGPGSIRIDARASDGQLVLEVFNSGPALDEARCKSSSGIGLHNTRERLSLHYGDRAVLTLSNVAPAGVRASITLPLSPASVPVIQPA